MRFLRIIERFGSIEAATATDTGALGEVDGIGPAVAHKLRGPSKSHLRAMAPMKLSDADEVVVCPDTDGLRTPL